MWARTLFALAAAASSLIGSDGGRQAVASAVGSSPRGRSRPPPISSSCRWWSRTARAPRSGRCGRKTSRSPRMASPSRSRRSWRRRPPAEGGIGADGRFVVVALDNITTPAEIAWRVKDIANYFVDRMGPADDLSVITLANGRASSGDGPEAARAAIRRFGPTIYTARTRAEVVAEGLRVPGIAHRADGEVAASAQGAGHHRRQPTCSTPASRRRSHDVGPDLSVHWEGAVRNASRSNVSVYLIDPRGHAPMAEATSRDLAVQRVIRRIRCRAERPPILRLFRRRHLGQLHQSDRRAGLGQHQQLQGRGRVHLARRRHLLPAGLPDAGQRPPAARHRSEGASGRPEAASPPRPRVTGSRPRSYV